MRSCVLVATVFGLSWLARAAPTIPSNVEAQLLRSQSLIHAVVSAQEGHDSPRGHHDQIQPDTPPTSLSQEQQTRSPSLVKRVPREVLHAHFDAFESTEQRIQPFQLSANKRYILAVDADVPIVHITWIVWEAEGQGWRTSSVFHPMSIFAQLETRTTEQKMVYLEIRFSAKGASGSISLREEDAPEESDASPRVPGGGDQQSAKANAAARPGRDDWTSWLWPPGGGGSSGGSGDGKIKTN